MKPNQSLITITDNCNQIKKLLNELILQPRAKALQWSEITRQTPNIKIGYPGQHLASLITGMPGEGTGARGNDLTDGSEVKSCSRIDQLDKCKACQEPVLRIEVKCSNCGSTMITRNKDSKWLFSLKNEHDLQSLIKEIPRIVLILSDYPYFDQNNYDTLRFQSWEIWPQSDRQHRFQEIITNYYNEIYLQHKNININKTPAPKNFWPYLYDFYICNPILTFSCFIYNSTSETPQIDIQTYIEPHIDRSFLPSILMPTNLLRKNEIKIISKYLKEDKNNLPEYIDENIRQHLPLRKTNKISTSKTPYKRRRKD